MIIHVDRMMQASVILSCMMVFEGLCLLPAGSKRARQATSLDVVPPVLTALLPSHAQLQWKVVVVIE